MALMADIKIDEDRIEFICDAELERGGIVSLVAGPTGTVPGYPGDGDHGTGNRCNYVADPANAAPLGVLFPSVKNYSGSKGHMNWEQAGFVQHTGDHVMIINRGWVVTNMIPSGITPTAGATAYLAANGLISSTQATNAPAVGRFLSAKNAAGYAKVEIRL